MHILHTTEPNSLVLIVAAFDILASVVYSPLFLISPSLLLFLSLTLPDEFRFIVAVTIYVVVVIMVAAVVVISLHVERKTIFILLQSLPISYNHYLFSVALSFRDA